MQICIAFYMFQMYAYSILREPLLGHLCNALAAILQDYIIRFTMQICIAFYTFQMYAYSVQCFSHYITDK